MNITRMQEFFLVESVPSDLVPKRRREFTPLLNGKLLQRPSLYAKTPEDVPIKVTTLIVPHVSFKFRIAMFDEHAFVSDGRDMYSYLTDLGYKVKRLGLGHQIEDVLIPFTMNKDLNYNCHMLLEHSKVSTHALMEMSELYKNVTVAGSK